MPARRQPARFALAPGESDSVSLYWRQVRRYRSLSAGETSHYCSRAMRSAPVEAQAGDGPKEQECSTFRRNRDSMIEGEPRLGRRHR